jgi:hypothetical protein
MEFIKELLDPNGRYSTTRATVIWLVVNATFMGWYVILFGTEHATEATMIMGAVTAIASALKVYQKSQEKPKE